MGVTLLGTAAQCDQEPPGLPHHQAALPESRVVEAEPSLPPSLRLPACQPLWREGHFRVQQPPGGVPFFTCVLCPQGYTVRSMWMTAVPSLTCTPWHQSASTTGSVWTGSGATAAFAHQASWGSTARGTSTSASPTHVTNVGPRTACSALTITYASADQATQASITIPQGALSVSLPAHKKEMVFANALFSVSCL